jgi:hypothetical protein
MPKGYAVMRCSALNELRRIQIVVQKRRNPTDRDAQFSYLAWEVFLGVPNAPIWTRRGSPLATPGSAEDQTAAAGGAGDAGPAVMGDGLNPLTMR